jgi:hypothetical protein
MKIIPLAPFVSMRQSGRERASLAYIDWFCDWVAGRSYEGPIMVLGLPTAPARWCDGELDVLAGVLEYIVQRQEECDAQADAAKESLVFTGTAATPECGDAEGARSDGARMYRDDPHWRTEGNDESSGFNPAQVSVERGLIDM